MRTLVFAMLLAVGCDSTEPAAPDAAIAIDAPEINTALVPFTTTGSTPAGSLDDVRFLGVSYLDGFCPPGYYVTLYRTNALYGNDAVVTVTIPMSDELTAPPTGTIAATAHAGSDWDARIDASFAVEQADLWSTQPQRIAGRVTANTGAWVLDFAIDAQTERHTCI